MKSQALGLAMQLSAKFRASIIQHTVITPAIVRLLPASLQARVCQVTPPVNAATAPDIAINCGIDGQAFTALLGKRYGTFTICIQRPRIAAKLFNAIVAPRHDYSIKTAHRIDKTKNSKIILTIGAVGRHNQTPSAERRSLAKCRFAQYPPPYVAALIGGDNRTYQIDAQSLIKQLSEIIKQSGATLLTTPSRRTDVKITRALHDTFGAAHYIWDGNDGNPYDDILAAADGFCVTCDSVNMISEACTNQKTVYLLPLAKKKHWRARRNERKFAHFHSDMENQRQVRWWQGKWEWLNTTPMNETARAATALCSLLSIHRPYLFSQTSNKN